MGEKISTKEEIILMYLADGDELIREMYKGNIEKNNETRQAIIDLGDPSIARCYMEYVLKRPEPCLKEIVCQNPYEAYLYAVYTQREPCDETRNAAAKEPESAYRYARVVDHKHHEVTWLAVQRDDYWKKAYIQTVTNWVRAQDLGDLW